MRGFLMIFLAFSVLSMPVTVDSAWAQTGNRLYDSLNFLNRQKPLQNPRFQRADQVLKNRILDRSNRVVGEVNDILLTSNGDISTLNVELDRLRVRGDVFLGYSQMRMRSVTRAYTLNIDDDQLKDLVPSLLNNIETASGNGSDVFSLRKLDGARLVAEDGRRLGKIENVLFSDNAGRAQALYVDLNYRSVRGEKIAIPFSTPRYVAKPRSFDVVLKNDEADAILEYARNR